MSAEVWAVFPADPRISVSTYGRVKFLDVLAQQQKPRRLGYCWFETTKHQQRVRHAIHRLVLLTFRGPCPVGHSASHLDGDPSNNRLENLAWETHSANCLRKRQHGTAQTFERNGWHKLTEQEVNDICRSSLSSRAIAPIYGVADAHIRRLRRQHGFQA